MLPLKFMLFLEIILKYNNVLEKNAYEIYG